MKYYTYYTNIQNHLEKKNKSAKTSIPSEMTPYGKTVFEESRKLHSGFRYFSLNT